MLRKIGQIAVSMPIYGINGVVVSDEEYKRQ